LPSLRRTAVAAAQLAALESALQRLCPGFWPFC
jgi:hypothetical protein